jgi:uncharacterized protein (TIGR03067 family)
MRGRLVLVLAAGLLVAADRAKKDDHKSASGLEGTWEVVSFTKSGQENEKAKGDKVVFQGKNLVVKTPKGEQKFTFTIDPKKKTIDIVPGGLKDKTAKGIYQLKKGGLKICLADVDKERPTKFTSKKDSGHTLVILKRVKSE